MVLPCLTNHWNEHQVSAWRPTTAFCEVHLPLAVSVSPLTRPWEKWRAAVSSTTRHHPSWGQTYSQEHESSEEEPGSVAYYECIFIYMGYINIIYICVCVCVAVDIYYIHIWLPIITHRIPKRLQPNPMTRNPCKGSEKDCLDFHGETTARRWERAWQSENVTDLVCVWCQQLSYIFKNAWCHVLSTLPLIIIVLPAS